MLIGDAIPASWDCALILPTKLKDLHQSKREPHLEMFSLRLRVSAVNRY